jgi:GT2 family glycosyltransferase
MKLSIVIVTWNTAEITRKCVDTIQKYLPKNFAEIIIVDNDSTDNTKEIFSKNKSITYHLNSGNLGFAKGNNIGAKLATTDYLFFLNSDMEFLDSKLVDMLDFYQNNPDCGLVGPQFLNIDLTPQGSVFPNQSILNAFKEFWLKIPAYSKYVPQSSTPLSVWSISGGAILIKKSLFEKIGGWNEKYFMYYEDMALCRSLRSLDKKIYYYPNFRVVHHHGASGKTLANPANQWRRLIPSSKIYHGPFKHYLLFLITWSGQKFHQLFNKD